MRQQAFTPSISVKSNGIVVVSYVDFRNDTGAAGQELADYWAVSCKAECGSVGSWKDEIRLTPASFNIVDAPFAGGYFLGDHSGRAAVGADTGAAFAIPRADNSARIVFRKF